MSCPPELTYDIYIDGELDASQRRLVDAHLVGCRSCRILVSALRDEADLLADALHDREPGWVPASALPTAEPSFAIGLPIAITAITAAISVVGFIANLHWPGGLSLLNPLRLKGSFELVFDLVFALRDRVPGLPELALALGLVAAASGLMSFVVKRLDSRLGHSSMSIGVALPLGMLGWIASVPYPASALDLRIDQDVYLAAGDRIPEALVASGDSIDIDGVIDGDLVAFAERVTIRGRIEGNVYAFTRDLEISGVVTGSVHGGTERTRIAGRVDGSVYSGSGNFSIGVDGSIGRDAALWAEEAAFDGAVGRDVYFTGNWLEIRGPVGRDVEVHRANRLSLRDGARIGGDVDAVLEADEIEIASGAEIAGEATRVAPKGVEDRLLGHYLEPGYYVFLGLRYAGGVLFGVLLFAAIPGLFDPRATTTRSLFRSMGRGFIFVIAAPVLIVCSALTIVGIPVAVLGAFVYVVTLYSAKIAVGALVGQHVMGTQPGIVPFALALMVGLGLLSLAAALPFVGLAISIVAVLYGLGILWDRALEFHSVP